MTIARLCQKCGHSWNSLSPNPQRCPKCLSRMWRGPVARGRPRGRSKAPKFKLNPRVKELELSLPKPTRRPL